MSTVLPLSSFNVTMAAPQSSNRSLKQLLPCGEGYLALWLEAVSTASRIIILQVLYLSTYDHRMLTHVLFQCVCVCVCVCMRHGQSDTYSMISNGIVKSFLAKRMLVSLCLLIVLLSV